MQFEVKFYDGSVEVVDGTRVYSDEDFYFIDDKDFPQAGAWYKLKSEVKCISPVKGE